MPLIKTLSQTLKQDKEKFKDTEVCPAGNPHPQDLAGWDFSGRE